MTPCTNTTHTTHGRELKNKDPLLYFTDIYYSPYQLMKKKKVAKRKYVQLANGINMWKPWPPRRNTTNATHGRELKIKDPMLYLQNFGISFTNSWKKNKVTKQKYVQVVYGFHMWRPWPPSTNTTHATHGREFKNLKTHCCILRISIISYNNSWKK